MDFNFVFSINCSIFAENKNNYMIRKIIHLADIHIPNDNSDKPYFSELLKQLAGEIMLEIKDDNKDEVRIVIVGDIFEKKIKADNESKDLFHEFLNYINAMAKTIIVAGNHDMLENNQDRMDSISPTFSIKGVYPNITYADRVLKYKSGYIKDDNIIWAVYSMFDKFAKPNIDGLKETYPDCKIVGLYHGEVPGAVTDVGRMSEKGINTDDFKECDCVMAGHIHKYQTIKKNGVPIVYSSSVFQKDSGENTTGHGFVVWDIDTMKYKLHEVKNPYKTYKFEISSYEDIQNNEEKLLNL